MSWQIIANKIKNAERNNATDSTLKIVNELLRHIMSVPTCVIPWDDIYIFEWRVGENLLEIEIDTNGLGEVYFYTKGVVNE